LVFDNFIRIDLKKQHKKYMNGRNGRKDGGKMAKQQKNNEPFLHLDLSSWEKEAGRETYRVIAEIWLSRWSGNSPRVQITVDGALWQGQDFYILDKQYCFTAQIAGLTPGPHSIVVVTTDGRHRNVKSINIPTPEKEKQKKPAKIVARETYLKGGCILTFQILTEEGDVVSKAILQISDQTGGRGSHNLSPTDSRGVTKRKIMFKPGEKEIFMRIVVLGSELSIWKNLFND